MHGYFLGDHIEVMRLDIQVEVFLLVLSDLGRLGKEEEMAVVGIYDCDLLSFAFLFHQCAAALQFVQIFKRFVH